MKEIEDDNEMITEEGKSFTVLAQRLKGLCENCIHVLEFKHH